MRSRGLVVLAVAVSLMAAVGAASAAPVEPAASRLWVAPAGRDDNDGSKDAPLASINHALSLARPGTTVLVRAGTYEENVRFRRGGAPGAPVSMVSVDGAWAAVLRPADPGTRTVQGYGVGHIVLDGFRISGAGSDAVTFTRAGEDFSRLAHDIIIRNNYIHDANGDGIKIAQADRVQILDNVITRTRGQGIDFVAVNDSLIAGNDVSRTPSNALIMVKGGSARVRIVGNLTHTSDPGKATNGILIGGSTETPYFRPGLTTQEAYDVVAEGNVVHSVERGIQVMGARGSVVRGNEIRGVPGPAVHLASSDVWHVPPLDTRDTVVVDNEVARTHWFAAEAGQGAGLVVEGTRLGASVPPWHEAPQVSGVPSGG